MSSVGGRSCNTDPLEVEASIRALIVKQLGVTIDRVVPEARLVEDLRADFVALTQLALAIEEALGVDLEDAEWMGVEYVGQAVEYVRACQARPAVRRVRDG